MLSFFSKEGLSKYVQWQDQDQVKANMVPDKSQLRPGPGPLKFHATVQVAV